MTATTFDSGALPDLPMQVKNKTLLGIMAIVPIAGLLALIDKPLLGGFLIDNMTTNPGQIAYWTAILTVPHIIASLLTFADSEYVSYHKKRILKGIIIALLLGFGVPFVTGIAITDITGRTAGNLLDYAAAGSLGTLVAMAFYTMYHNLMQQYGIALMMMRQPPTFDYQMWRWFTIVPAGLAYTALMTSMAREVQENWDLILNIITGGVVIATIFGIRFLRTILKNPNHTKIGLAYFLANMSLIYVTFALILTGYGFMATLVPRLTHDFTAFWIYIVHDQNRNAATTHNPIYWLPKKLGLQPKYLCAPIAIALSLWLLGVADSLFAVALFVTSLNFLHYYLEGYMWKRGMPHRQSVPFV